MDGFKNTTRMKYMCGGPVKKATGGVIKSAAPKSVAKAAAPGKQLPTPEIASKRQVQPTPPKDVRTPRATEIAPKPLVNRPAPKDAGREIPRPTMEPKRQVQPSPPKSAKTIGGAPKSAKTMGGEPRRSNEGISAKQLLAGTAGDYAAPPEKVKTMGGEPKTPKGGGDFAAKIMASKSPQTKIMGGAPEKASGVGDMYRKATAALRGVEAAPEKAAAAPRGMGGAPEKAMGSVNPGAKTVSSAVTAKRGVPVASKKPMIGLKTGGHVTKSMTKW